MRRKMCVVMAITAFLGLELLVVQSAQAQMLRRLMGRRNSCCPTDCCTTCATPAPTACSPCASSAVTCAATPVSYEAPATSYVQPAVQPASYVEAAPAMATFVADSGCGCGDTTLACGGEVGCGSEVAASPAMEVTPATYATACAGCDGMATEMAPASAVAYETNSAGDCGCGGTTVMMNGYESGTATSYVDGAVMPAGYVDGQIIEGAPLGCPNGDCGGIIEGGVVDANVIYEGDAMPIEAPAADTIETTDTPPAAPSEDIEADSENKEA